MLFVDAHGGELLGRLGAWLFSGRGERGSAFPFWVSHWHGDEGAHPNVRLHNLRSTDPRAGHGFLLCVTLILSLVANATRIGSESGSNKSFIGQLVAFDAPFASGHRISRRL